MVADRRSSPYGWCPGGKGGHQLAVPRGARVVRGMDEAKMDENEWRYHGEGNKSLVVAHAQVSGGRSVRCPVLCRSLVPRPLHSPHPHPHPVGDLGSRTYFPPGVGSARDQHPLPPARVGCGPRSPSAPSLRPAGAACCLAESWQRGQAPPGARGRGELSAGDAHSRPGPSSTLGRRLPESPWPPPPLF